MIRQDSVHDAMEKLQLINDRLKSTQSCQKSYVDVKRRELDFQVDDWDFLKVSRLKGVMRFCKKGKLSPRYVVTYNIFQRVGKVSYELELPTELAAAHPVVHILFLKKCVCDQTSIVPLVASLASLLYSTSLDFIRGQMFLRGDNVKPRI